MPEGEEEEEIIEKTLLQQQLQKSYDLLDKLSIEANEFVTNVRVANDSREIDRKEQENIIRDKIIVDLETEATSAEVQFQEVASKWLSILESNDPLHIHDEIINQKEKCDALIKQKDELIATLKNQIVNAELSFSKDQKKQTEDIDTLAERIEKQVVMMRGAYRQELQLIEDVIMVERKILMDANDKKWEELYKRRDNEEQMNTEKKTSQLEEFEEICTQLRIDHQEKYRETKIKLENDVENLEEQLEEIKTLALMNSEKLDYNYQILKKREDENLIIKSQQKRKINKLQDAINMLRQKTKEYTSNTNNQIEKLSTDVCKMQASVLAIEAKADHFSSFNDTKYKQVWEFNKKAAVDVLNRILTIDRILYEQQLGLKWVNPDQTILEKTDLPSYRSALQVVADLYKKGDGDSNTKDKSLKTPGDKEEAEERPALEPENETMAHRRILRLVLKLVADKSGFLIEDRLKEVLEPYAEQEKTLIKVDSVFVALTIKRKEEIEILLDYFLPYAHCPICMGLRPLEIDSGGSSETELASHSFLSPAISETSSAAPPPTEVTLDQSSVADAIQTTDIMSAIHQPDMVIDQIISTITDFTNLPNYHSSPSRLEVSGADESKDASNGSLKSIEFSNKSGKTSKTLSKTASKISCQNRHPLVISSVYILRALREFVSKFYVPKEGIKTMKARLMHKRSTLSRLMVGEDVKMYWESFKNAFPSAKRELWDGLMIGLHKYHEILKDRKKLNDEVVVLRRQNEELKYLLSCYKKDAKDKMKPPCALQRELPIRPTKL